MILIFGGAYQGKKEYVINKYKIKDAQIYNCKTLEKYGNSDGAGSVGNLEEAAGPFPAADHLEAWILRETRAGRNAEEELRTILDGGSWAEKVIICADITQGVVPADAEMRKWRDQTGKCLQLLASRADEVVRVFCGIGEIVKSRGPQGN